MKPLPIAAFTLVSALGRGVQATYAALAQRRSGLRPCDFDNAELDTYIGRVDGLESEPVIDALRKYDCRNNRLAQLGLRQDGFEETVARARERYGARRIGTFIGTSTSGIQQTELAYQHREPGSGTLPVAYRYGYTGNISSAASFVQRYLHLQGPVTAISTACSSSAKVFATAHRFIKAGLCDAAVVGGSDSLCLNTLYGFRSLELVSSRPCRPADRERDGISIGEAAGFALLEPSVTSEIALLGYGESSDGYHMSAPHPEGLGARIAMERALACARLHPGDIDYVNLHGTATPANDLTEDLAICKIFGSSVACSSTKGWTGHALGAAGITEAVICMIGIAYGLLPGSINTCELDAAMKSNIVLDNQQQALQRVMSNSFGFGGNNCSLILGVTG
jgi:3-oxoacyl-[acyl-carrier-protein] synthase I